MKLTNKYNLPKTITNALERDDYSKGPARMSVTGLLKPPRIGLLYRRHHQLIEKDASDQIWSLFGRAVHSILEKGGDEEHIPEERLFIEVRGWIISGQLDLQKLGDNRVKIVDYKTTTAYSVRSEKAEWVEQLNTYAHLLRVARGHEIDSLAICALIRDWNRHQASQGDYPPAPIQMIDIPLWSPQQAQSFVEGRVRIHQEALAGEEMGDEPPECSDAERWMRKPQYRVMKGDNKRASKVFGSPEEANDYASKDASLRVEVRKGEPIRCTGDYCNVSAWCKQYQEWKNAADRSDPSG